MNKYAGGDWVARQPYGANISPAGRAAADLLGDAFLGIYHLNERSLAKVNWANPEGITVTIGAIISTVDDNILTRLVVLAHDRVLRVQIQGVGNGYLRVSIHQRTREGNLYEYCPTLEDHAATLRNHYGATQ
jgi:hypothetical protein